MSTADNEYIDVEVAYARPDQQVVVSLRVRRGTTVEEVVRRSGIPGRFPEIDLEVNKVGIFGEVTGLGETPQDGDRVEIYRPLLIDPKEARRLRASADRSRKQSSRKPAG